MSVGMVTFKTTYPNYNWPRPTGLTAYSGGLHPAVRFRSLNSGAIPTGTPANVNAPMLNRGVSYRGHLALALALLRAMQLLSHQQSGFRIHDQARLGNLREILLQPGLALVHTCHPAPGSGQLPADRTLVPVRWVNWSPATPGISWTSPNLLHEVGDQCPRGIVNVPQRDAQPNPGPKGLSDDRLQLWGINPEPPVPVAHPNADRVTIAEVVPLPGAAIEIGRTGFVRGRIVSNIAAIEGYRKLTNLAALRVANPSRIGTKGRQGDRKRRLGSGISAILTIIANFGGELIEWIDMLAKAAGYNKKEDYYGWGPFSGITGPEDTNPWNLSPVAHKAYWLFYEGNISNIDVDMLLGLMAENALEDWAWGTIGQAHAGALQGLGTTSGGFAFSGGPRVMIN